MFFMLKCVAVCCSVLQCAAQCCNVLQCVAVCCSASLGVAKVYLFCTGVLQCTAVCCNVPQYIALAPIYQAVTPNSHPLLRSYNLWIKYYDPQPHMLGFFVYHSIWIKLLPQFVPLTCELGCICHGVATISRLLKIIGRFCKRAL